MKQQPRRVLLVDDHPIVRRGVTQLLNAEPDLEVCGEAETAAHALELLQTCDPDVAVVDLTLAGGNGLGLVKDLKAWRADLPILILSMHDESLHAERALRAGATGYVMKQEATDRIVEALRRVLRGQIFLSQPMQDKLLQRLVGDREALRPSSPLEAMTDRELEVFQLVGRGLSTRDVADELCLSVKTIETHLDRIKSKLGLESGRELVRYAIRWTLDGT
jgi:DNA-binding NarL/FixJ family response regulator